MAAKAFDFSAWRALTVEEPIELDLPIIDAHHHFWPKPPVPGFEAYRLDDLLADKIASGHNIVATVCIDSHAGWRAEGPEALRPVGETELVERLAGQCSSAGGRAAGAYGAIVPHADLMLGAAVAEVLDAHREASPERFRGIRHMTLCDPDYTGVQQTFPQMMGSAPFREGFAALAERRLSFDAWVAHPQLPELAQLAHSFPEVPIIVNHLGGPVGIGRYAARRAEAFIEWRSGLRGLADCPNVKMKLGGLMTPIIGMTGERGPAPRSSRELAADYRDFQLTVIDLFGAGRCMFESNFPVDRIWASATVTWNAFKRAVADFSAEDKALMFHDVAAATYRPVMP